MRVALDTSVIVDIDRKREETITIIRRLIERDHIVLVSTVTVSEILAGSYLKEDAKKAVAEAKRILGQFLWIDLDSEIAERTGQYLAELMKGGRMIDYQDVVIAATVQTTGADYLLTPNTAHFLRIPQMKAKVYTPHGFLPILERGEKRPS